MWDKVTFTGNWRRPLPPAQARWGHHSVLVYNFVPIESRAPTPGVRSSPLGAPRGPTGQTPDQHLDGLAE